MTSLILLLLKSIGIKFVQGQTLYIEYIELLVCQCCADALPWLAPHCEGVVQVLSRLEMGLFLFDLLLLCKVIIMGADLFHVKVVPDSVEKGGDHYI